MVAHTGIEIGSIRTTGNWVGHQTSSHELVSNHEMSNSTEENGPDWVHLNPDEEILWSGHQSAYTLVSSIVGGLAFIAVGIIGVAYLVTVDFGESVPSAVAYAPLIFPVFGVLSITISYLRWRYAYYVVTTKELYQRRGILTKDTEQMRINRIQNTDYNQSIIERLLSFGDIMIYTAGSDDFDFVMRNVPNPNEIIKKLTIQIGEIESQHDGSVTSQSAEDGI